MDIVWVVNVEKSLKSTAGQKRGKGVRRRVAQNTTMSQNCKDFLCGGQQN